MRIILIKLFSALILFFTLSSISVLGQREFKSGFIIKINNDTIHGVIQELNEREKGFTCNFRVDDQDFEYSPDDIRAYKFKDGNLYESHRATIKGEEKQIFMLTLVKGRASLYYSVDSDFEDHYFAHKGDIMKEIQVADESFEQWDYEKSKNSVGTLTIMFNDCPDPERKLNASSFHPNRVQGFFIDYNNCYAGIKTSEVGKRERNLRLIKGVEVGYSYSELKWKSPYRFETDEGFLSNQLNFGAVIGLNFPQTRFSLLSGIYYGKYHWEATQFDIRKNTSYNYYDYAFNYSYIKAPLALKFTITRRKINPYVKAGGFMDFWISKETQQSLRIYMDPDYKSSSSIEDIEDTKVEEELWTSEQGYLVGIGVDYKLNEKMIIYFESLYEGGNGILKKTFSTTSTFNFKLGFSF